MPLEKREVEKNGLKEDINGSTDPLVKKIEKKCNSKVVANKLSCNTHPGR